MIEKIFKMTEGYWKVFILLLTTLFVESCCTPPSFVDKNCISYECNSPAITDTDFELASLEPTKRMDFFQLFFQIPLPISMSANGKFLTEKNLVRYVVWKWSNAMISGQ